MAASAETDDVLTFADLANHGNGDAGGDPRRTSGGAGRAPSSPCWAAHPRQVLTREQIEGGLGLRLQPSSNSLDVYVMYLRRKTKGGEPRLVHTGRWAGYVLRQGGAE
ncbi:Two-component system response regulator MprA OS=Streptomyces albaduncus OX=68172 GN=FHS32_006890 PE=4 SV=1 [Streptomyces griseoloalbus]